MTTTTVHYPQPHEGVGGLDRPDDPLVGPGSPRDVILNLADALYSATLVGHPAPKVAALFARMGTPFPGDTVIVWDALVMRDPETRYRAVGYLIEHRAEWWTTDEEWERAKAAGEVYEDDPRPVERHAWYVQYGPAAADVCRWTNCTVLAIPAAGRWDL